MSARDVVNKLQGVKRSGAGWTAKCPAHEDQHNSLSVNEGDGGRVLFYCHAGCSYERIVAALGFTNGTSSRRIVAEYGYRDESGRLLYEAIRFEPKAFQQRRPDGRGGYIWNLNGTKRVLYGLPELLAADPQGVVYIPEGEKDVDELRKHGLVATCNVGGAGKWRDEYNECLRGRQVVILPDNDEPGQKHAARVARSLSGRAASVRVVELPDLPPKGDVSDWLNAGGTLEQLSKLVKATPQWEETQGTQNEDSALHIVRMIDVAPEEVRWLWHPYIPLGKLTLIDGDPGVGKSSLTCALAAGVTCGRGLPGAGVYETGSVLMLSAEDGLGDTLRPRLDAVGADVSRVLALAEPLTLDMPGLVRLEAAIIEHKPTLVIIDPLFAYTGGKVDIHRANECRAISAPLAAIAERRCCALIAVRHLGKSRGGGHPLNAGIGSIDFVAAARSVLLVGADPDDPSRRAVVQIKNNLAAHGPAIGYTLEDGCFYWTGESDLTKERILAAATDEEERGTIADAVDFLRAALATGARDSQGIKDEARQGGISDATLRRAKGRLKVRVRKVGAPGSHSQKWVWELPAAEGAQNSAEGAQVRYVEHLRTNETNKDSYGNDLAEGAQGINSEHLRESVEHLRVDGKQAALSEVAEASRSGDAGRVNAAIGQARAAGASTDEVNAALGVSHSPPDEIYIPKDMTDEEYERKYEETRTVVSGVPQWQPSGDPLEKM